MTAIWSENQRVRGLRRFAAAITILTVLGHVILGFEPSCAHPLVALATAYSMETVLEAVRARTSGRRPRFSGGVGALVTFLLPAHITGLAVAMLIYSNQQLMPVAFATGAAIASKVIFTAPVEGASRHFLNPSNFGISLTLALFPFVGISPPYQYTENILGAGDWIIPILIVASGFFLNARHTGRLPLIAGWLTGFLIQALIRSLWQGTPLLAALAPMTGVAFVLYTFYMVTDPGTTPRQPRAQAVFGLSVALVYGVLVRAHIVFDLFFSLTLVCAARGIGLHARAYFGTPMLQRSGSRRLR